MIHQKEENNEVDSDFWAPLYIKRMRRRRDEPAKTYM